METTSQNLVLIFPVFIMSRVPKRLTDRRIATALPKNKPYFLFAGDGLCIEIRPTGRKYWRVRRKYQGKIKVITLGLYPSLLLADARVEHEKILSFPPDVDPLDEYERMKSGETAFTFRTLADEMLSRKAVTDSYRRTVERCLTRHIFPVLGNKDIRQISGNDLYSLLLDVSVKENEQGGKMTFLARQLCSWCGEVFDYASIVIKDFYFNPCPAVKRRLPKHTAKKTRRIDITDLGEFVRVIENTRTLHTVRGAVWMLLYTGQRQISIYNATWGDFNLDEAVWIRKPEKKDTATHRIPLPRQAVKVLQVMRLLSGNASNDDFVFHGIKKNVPIATSTISELFRRKGFDMTGHGLRGLVTTGLNELSKQDNQLIRMGVNKEVIEMQIGHRLPGVAGRYDDSKYFDVRRSMMQIWADYLDSLKESFTD